MKNTAIAIMFSLFCLTSFSQETYKPYPSSIVSKGSYLDTLGNYLLLDSVDISTLFVRNYYYEMTKEVKEMQIITLLGLKLIRRDCLVRFRFRKARDLKYLIKKYEKEINL